jgi:hypothetical protein
MADRDIGQHWNRDDEQKPGRPQRTAYEPPGSEGSARNGKTLTDPATGERLPGAPEPNRSEADDRD